MDRDISGKTCGCFSKELFPTKWSFVIFIGYMVLFINQGILVTASKNKEGSFSYNPAVAVLFTECVKVIAALIFFLKDEGVGKLIPDVTKHIKGFFTWVFSQNLVNRHTFKSTQLKMSVEPRSLKNPAKHDEFRQESDMVYRGYETITREISQSLDHLPQDLKASMMEFRSCKSRMKLVEEVPYLVKLAEYYAAIYHQNPADWISQLRAHALYISCSERDPVQHATFLQLAFNMMDSCLTLEELRELTKANRTKLARLRKKYRQQAQDLKTELLPKINSENLEDNEQFIFNFTLQIRDFFKDITNEMKSFISQLTDQSLQSLGASSETVGIAFVAIGSLARCETTPYSDVEYFFLIERCDDLSMKLGRELAVQTYLFLGNLGETSLPTLDIPELVAITFEDKWVKGMRIDGLAEKAGNIPTGNKLDKSNERIFTVDQLTEKYRAIVKSSETELKHNKDMFSDMVDMISHRTLIWSTGNGAMLFKKAENELGTIQHSEKRQIRSLNILKADLHNYNFLPSETITRSVHQYIKWDIYRYPSLCAIGLNNTLDLKTRTNWETLDTLAYLGTCSYEFVRIMSFLLSAALFLRVDAYLFYDAQHDEVTLLELELENGDDALYSCPRDLLLLTMSYLFPLKKSLIKLLEQSSSACMVSLPDIQQDTFTSVCISHFYWGAYSNVAKLYSQKFGKDVLLMSAEDLLPEIDQQEFNLLFSSALRCGVLAEKHLNLIEAAEKFYHGWNGNEYRVSCCLLSDPESAKKYAHLFLEAVDETDVRRLFTGSINATHSHIFTGEMEAAENYLGNAFKYLKQMQSDPDYTHQEYLRWKMNYHNALAFKSFKEGKYEVLLNAAMQELQAAESLYGFGVIHSDIAMAINSVGKAHYCLKHPEQSLVFFQRGLNMSYRLYGEFDPQADTAYFLMNIGLVNYELKKFSEAESHFTKSWGMRCKLYSGMSSVHPDITMVLGHIADCRYNLANIEGALQKSVEQYNNLMEENALNTLELAKCTYRIACCHYDMKQLESAKKNAIESLKFFNKVNQPETDEKIKALETLLSNVAPTDY